MVDEIVMVEKLERGRRIVYASGKIRFESYPAEKFRREVGLVFYENNRRKF